MDIKEIQSILLIAGYPSSECNFSSLDLKKFYSDPSLLNDFKGAFQTPLFVWVDSNNPDMLHSVVVIPSSGSLYLCETISERVGEITQVKSISFLTEGDCEKISSSHSIQQNVCYLNNELLDQYASILDNPLFQFIPAESAHLNQSEREGQIQNTVYRLSKQFNLPVDACIVTNSDVKKMKNRDYLSLAVAWYDDRNDAVFLNIDKCVTAEMAAETMMHECVGHYGLRKLLGKRYENFLIHIFEHACEPIRFAIKDIIENNLMIRNNSSMSERDSIIYATDEYLAGIAQKMSASHPSSLEHNIFQRLVDLVTKAFHYIKFDIPWTLNEKDLVWLLNRSNENVQRKRFGQIFIESLPKNRFTKFLHHNLLSKNHTYTSYIELEKRKSGFFKNHPIMRRLLIICLVPFGLGIPYVAVEWLFSKTNENERKEDGKFSGNVKRAATMQHCRIEEKEESSSLYDNHLSPQAMNQISTRQFRDFFGKGNSGSKMTDDNGIPLVCYHGTHSTFEKFDINAPQSNDGGYYGKGIYFCFGNGELSRQEASFYGPKIRACFLNIRNPFVFSNLYTFRGHEMEWEGKSVAFLMNISKQFPQLDESLAVQKFADNRLTMVKPSEFEKLFDKYNDDIIIREIKNEEYYFNTPTVLQAISTEVYSYRDTLADPKNLLSGSTVLLPKELSLLFDQYIEACSDDSDKKDVQLLKGIYEKKFWEYYDSDPFFIDAKQRIGTKVIYEAPGTDSQEEIQLKAQMKLMIESENLNIQYHPEGYMTRHPSITAAIKEAGYDGILTSLYGDEAVVFSPEQIMDLGKISASELIVEDDGTFSVISTDCKKEDVTVLVHKLSDLGIDLKNPTITAHIVQKKGFKYSLASGYSRIDFVRRVDEKYDISLSYIGNRDSAQLNIDKKDYKSND